LPLPSEWEKTTVKTTMERDRDAWRIGSLNGNFAFGSQGGAMLPTRLSQLHRE